jgi:biopolymer transport protein ExbD
MGASVGPASGEAEEMVEMNVIPLIDILLVLIIMFIISLPVQTHAVKLDMPRPSDAEQSEPPVVIQLDVDFDGTIMWNGSVVTSTAQLQRYFQSISIQDPQPEVHLRPNRLAKYDIVAKVLAFAQRLGVTKIGFVGNEQYL